MDYVARNSGLTDDQLQRYEVTLDCRGNRDDLFAGIAFATPDGAGSSGEYQDYDIPKVNAVGMLTGMAEKQVIEDCLKILEG